MEKEMTWREFQDIGQRAIEKQKLVYILNRDAAARLTISSPLEAHKANTLVYHVVGVDVGFENPMFACLEMDYENDLDDPERGMIFVCSATHKTKSMFFFLAQTEQGDIFKVTLETDEEMVTEIRLKYFDTIPVATAMCVLKTGFLFVCSEFGNHYLYQIAHLGDDDEEPEFSSAMPLEEGDTFFFQPRPLKNLVLVDEQENLSPFMSCQIADLANEDAPQLYVACGRGPRSTLRVLRHGLEVSEMAVSELPGNPNAVWTVRKHVEDEFDAYIIVSFVNATLVLSIGETVEEVTDSGFLGTTPTLSCSLLGEDALVQSGQLNEYTERKEMSADVVCMSLANVPPGEQRSRFLAVGLVDNTVRIISLDPLDCLQPLSMQALPAQPESLCIVEMGGVEKQDELGEKGSIGFLYLNIGLQNGVLLRTVLDPVTGGDLSDTRTRYLGSRPVKLFRVRMQGQEAVLAMSSRSWLSYSYQYLTPLSYETLEYASGFASEQCPEGIVAISTNTLRILALEKLGAVFNQVAFPLQYTPRKFVIHPETNNLIVIETDHNAYTEATKAQRKQQMADV
ncbi:splicing factor 3B subunit 3-like [Pseudoliparis swirei]|uniref:splicing factor 3B subunit 3-like n=1 Tax=Pseudoliparis swirei TaxID=2059687 RepID=UPI0024BEBA24|nr:splicing factor 3B subunit 3-like [Pseudoliparis swirei]